MGRPPKNLPPNPSTQELLLALSYAHFSLSFLEDIIARVLKSEPPQPLSRCDGLPKAHPIYLQMISVVRGWPKPDPNLIERLTTAHLVRNGVLIRYFASRPGIVRDARKLKRCTNELRDIARLFNSIEKDVRKALAERQILPQSEDFSFDRAA